MSCIFLMHFCRACYIQHVQGVTCSFQQIVLHLLSGDQNLSKLIARFQEFLEYDDVRYYTMKHTLKILKTKNKQVLFPTLLI